MKQKIGVVILGALAVVLMACNSEKTVTYMLEDGKAKNEISITYDEDKTITSVTNKMEINLEDIGFTKVEMDERLKEQSEQWNKKNGVQLLYNVTNEIATSRLIITPGNLEVSDMEELFPEIETDTISLSYYTDELESNGYTKK